MKKMLGTPYLMWYDDNPKTSRLHKIEEAIEAYTRRFALQPNVVLVNHCDIIEYGGVHVRSAAFVRRNNFWVGFESLPDTSGSVG